MALVAGAFERETVRATCITQLCRGVEGEEETDDAAILFWSEMRACTKFFSEIYSLKMRMFFPNDNRDRTSVSALQDRGGETCYCRLCLCVVLDYYLFWRKLFVT